MNKDGQRIRQCRCCYAILRLGRYARCKPCRNWCNNPCEQWINNEDVAGLTLPSGEL